MKKLGFLHITNAPTGDAMRALPDDKIAEIPYSKEEKDECHVWVFDHSRHHATNVDKSVVFAILIKIPLFTNYHGLAYLL